jgi:hypothetical protein
MNTTKSTYTPRIASETFGTAIMKTDEAFLFIKAATENGIDLETAYDDMKMIDDILAMKRIHLAVIGHITKTKAGYLRKNSSIYDAMNDIINSRCQNQLK